MRFKEWFQKIEEAGTDTSCIAQFARSVIPSVRREYPKELGGTWPGKQKKEKRIKQQPQLKESIRLVDENGNVLPDTDCPHGHGPVKPMAFCLSCGWKNELS